MPQLSGLELCRRLRRRPETAHLPIIMLTARGEEHDRLRGLDLGADDFITKPFSPAELVARIRAVLRRGQEVEVIGGPFTGLLGIIQDPPDAKGRIKILLKLLSRQITVKLGVEFIKGEFAAYGPAVGADIGSGFISAAS